MSESRVLSNIPYTIHNRSNYDIVVEETREIVDVPYFPAQNLVDVSGELDFYSPNVDFYIPFIDQYNTARLFGLINRVDARFVFLEFADNARYLQYSFGGSSFPQGREDYAISYDGRHCYIYGGFANGRCMNDIWEYDIHTNHWRFVNFTKEILDVSQAAVRRKKASILVQGQMVWIFGGFTDILTINQAYTANFIPMNDLWSYDMGLQSWKQYDLKQWLPARTGHVIYADSQTIKILIKGGMNEIGFNEPTAIYTLDIELDEFNSEPYNPPFLISETNVLLTINGEVHIKAGDVLYKWDNLEGIFNLVLSDVSAINPIDSHYWVVNEVGRYFGSNSLMGSRTISEASLYAEDGTLVSTKTIGLLPAGLDISRINLDNVFTLFCGGLVNGSAFNSSTYVLNHTTLAISKYDFDPGQRPNDRVFPSLAYDKYRGRVYLFGGFDGTKFYNDLWYFDIGTREWTCVHGQLDNGDVDNPAYPQPRQKAGMAVTDENYLYIISGYSDQHSFSDFWRCNLSGNTWKNLFLIDNVPWGSAYTIFEWRDSLFLFNGCELYRYYDEHKQFAVQPFLASTDTGNKAGTDEADPPKKKPDELDVEGLLEAKRFLNTPIHVIVLNDCMFVQNSEMSFRVELETRVITDFKLQFLMDPKVNITWLDRYWGITDDGKSAYFINTSILQPLTKNQIPHSYFHKRINEPLYDGLFYRDITTMETSFLAYRDNSGIFRIQSEVDPVDKADLLRSRAVGYAQLQSEHPFFDFDNLDSWWDETVGRLADPTMYPFAPWFLYSKYITVNDMAEHTQRVLYNFKKKRIYFVYDNGNMIKYNPVDGTFFVHFSRIWKAAAIGYNEKQNKVYAFGGFRNPLIPTASDPILGGFTGAGANAGGAVDNQSASSEQPVYGQNGVLSERIIVPGVIGNLAAYEITHPGLLVFDLDLNELNVGTVQSYLEGKKRQAVDYSATKVYLTEIVRKHIAQYDADPNPTNLDRVEKTIYKATQPLLDDVSAKDFHFDSGIRPTGRAFTANVQVGNKLYIFGGCECWNTQCKCEQDTSPYWCTKPGRLAAFQGPIRKHGYWDAGPTAAMPAEAIAARCAPIDEAAPYSWYFDMDTQAWTQIANLPEWRYMASAITTPDNRYIYIVGGYTDEMVGGPAPAPPAKIPQLKPSRDIIIYSINDNTYEKLKGIPSTYAGRALPILNWLDDKRLLIMYGYRTIDTFEAGKDCSHYSHFHFPINDAWIYDTKSHLFYRAFRDLCGFMGIVAKDQFYIDEAIDKQSLMYVLTPTPDYNSFGDVVMKLYEWNLVNGEVTPMEVTPTLEVQEEYSGFEGIPKKKSPFQMLPPPEDTTIGSISDGTQSVSDTSVPGIPGIDIAAMPDPPPFPEPPSTDTTGNPYDNMDMSNLDTELEDTEPEDISFQTLFLSMYKNSNFRFRYSWVQRFGIYEHKHLFIIGEKCGDKGIQAIQKMILGYDEANLRIWYVDIEMPDGWKFLTRLEYSYPLPVAPTVIAYDGKEFLYCIYNKNHIWRLDFLKMMDDPEGSHWTKLPSCLDGNFLGDARMDPGWDAFFTPPNYLTLVSCDGRMARMDTEKFLWSFDKSLPPADPITIEVPEVGDSTTYSPGLAAATGVDNDEIYMYELGGISGKLMNVYEKQWDNFFFDMTATSGVVKYFSSIIGKKMWPSLVRRKRLYIINHLGHIFYSWLRIDGEYDVEFQLHNFYQGNELRIYCDHTFLMNWTNINVQVLTINSGWRTVPQNCMQSVENEIDWGWDSNYTRRYVRIVIDAFGAPKYQYSKCPPNYLSIDLIEAIGQTPVSHIRVSYKNTPKSYNYLSRINKVELITLQEHLTEYEYEGSTTPVDVLEIESITIDESYSEYVTVALKNTGSETIRDVIAYVFNNDWLQFSATPTVEDSWIRCNPSLPFNVAASIDSGAYATFYIRGINITDRPQVQDMVIRGVYPFAL
jgi:N-acetylneuraminic acid mutarotase